MTSYNFDNIDFDFDFGEIDEKKHAEIMKEAERVDKEEA